MKHPKHERTLVIIKPDGIQRTLIGEIIKRYERVGLKLVGLKMLIPTADMIDKHYTLDPEWMLKTGKKNIQAYIDKGLTPPFADPLDHSKVILEKLKKYMTSGPVIALVWEGAHAVAVVRKISGSTEPMLSAPGTIRGDFVLDSYKISDDDNRAVRNLVHSSGSVKEAEDEIKHWFEKEELFDYKIILEQMLYDVNLDGILE
ncbi:MAG: nucleoside-diphosphate kinase [Patescibacteria group bacterium]